MIQKKTNKLSLLLLFITSIGIIGISSKQAVAQNTPTKRVKNLQAIRSSQPEDPNSEIKKAIEEALNAKNYPEVHRLFNELQKDPDLTVLEKANLANYHGNICFSINDLDCALRESKRVVDMGEAIPEAFRNQMLYVIAQVLFSQENYHESLSYAQRWFKTLTEPTANSYLFIGYIHYQLKAFDIAIFNTITAIEIESSNGSIPKEGTLNLLQSSYRKTGQLEKMLPVIEQLIEYYPKEAYQLIFDKLKEDLAKPKNNSH